MSKTGRSKEASPSPWWLVLVVLFAAALRFGQLSTLPPGLHPDEARFGLSVLADDSPGLSQVIGSLFMRLWDTTPWALRASSAVAGGVLVWGAYLAAAALFPPEPKKTNWMPLAAAFLTAIFYPTLSLSRLGTGALWEVALATLAVACFWQGLNQQIAPVEPERSRRNRWPVGWQRLTHSPDVAWIISGVLLAAAAYRSTWSYLAFTVLILLLFLAVLRRTLSGEKRQRPLFFLLTAFLLTLFLGSLVWAWPLRSGIALSGNGLLQVLRGLFWSGATGLAYNLPGRPFLDVLQALLLIVGLGVTIRQGRQSRPLFLLLWLVVALLPALLVGDETYWLMLPDAAAPLAILSAMGLSWFSRQLAVSSQQVLKRPTAHWSLVTVYCLLFTSAFLTTRAYFSTYAQQPELAREFAVDEWQLGQSAAAYPPETLLYLSPPSANQATIQFALADPQRLWAFTPSAAVMPFGRLETPVLYLVAQEQAPLVAQLAEIFPDATVSEAPVPGYQFVYLPAFVPRLPQAHLTDLLWGGEIGLLDWQVVPAGAGVEVRLFWQAAADPSQNYVAYVHLLDEQGNLVASATDVLAGYPTTQWQVQEVIRGTLSLETLPSSGSYQLVTGFLNPTDQTPLGETFLTTWP